MSNLRYPIAKIKVRVVEPIDTRLLPSEWATPIDSIQKEVARSHGTHNEDKIRSMLWGTYNLALRWCLKEICAPAMRFGNSNKDGNMKYAQLLGQHFRATYELCEKCHGLGIEHSRRYRNAIEWTLAIVQEAFEHNLKEACTPREDRTGRERDYNKVIQNDIRTLKHYRRQNPFDANTFPHLWGLIECSFIRFQCDKEKWDVYMVGDAKDKRTQRLNGLGFLRTYQKLKHNGSKGLPSEVENGSKKGGSKEVKTGYPILENGEAVFSRGYRKGETIPELPFIYSSEVKPLLREGFTTYVQKNLTEDN